MLLGKKWKIESDNLNVMLLKRVLRKPKDKPSHYDWVVEGYYSDVSNALKGLADMGINETKLKDLETVVKKQGEIYRLIEQIKV